MKAEFCHYCGKSSKQQFCSESCALYAEQLGLLDGEPITPADPKLEVESES